MAVAVALLAVLPVAAAAVVRVAHPAVLPAALLRSSSSSLSKKKGTADFCCPLFLVC